MIHPNKAIQLAILSTLFALSGCATVYHTPPQSASLAERQQVYASQKAGYSWFNGVRVGGRQLPQGSWRSYPDTVANYYEAGGDTASAGIAAQAAPYYQAGLVTMLVGALGGLALQLSQGSSNPPWFAVGAVLGYGTQITLMTIGGEKYLRPSVASYNGYLRKDLGLEGQEP